MGLSELWNRYHGPVLPPQQQQLPQQQPEEVSTDTGEKVTKETTNEDKGERSDVRKRVKTVSLAMYKCVHDSILCFTNVSIIY